jgi:hypothetical protein
MREVVFLQLRRLPAGQGGTRAVWSIDEACRSAFTGLIEISELAG